MTLSGFARRIELLTWDVVVYRLATVPRKQAEADYAPLSAGQEAHWEVRTSLVDPDPYWAKIQEPDPNSMYLDPQHCNKQRSISSVKSQQSYGTAKDFNVYGTGLALVPTM